jgi:hypothetical protein
MATSTLFRTCRCGHTARRHEDDHAGPCLAVDCGCGEFTEPGSAVLSPELPPRAQPTLVPDPAPVTLPAPFPAPSAPITETGQYVGAIPASRLFVDSSYQRDANLPRVARMVAEFDVTRLGVLEVSDRGDGSYAIVEGQHRWLAARRAMATPELPDPPLVCQVHRGLDVAGEANLFYLIDRGRKVLSGYDRWKARRGSGENVVLQIEERCAAFDLQIRNTTKAGVIRSHVALEAVVDLGGLQLLTDTLGVLVQAYGRTVDAMDGDIIKGVAAVLHNYDEPEEIRRPTLIDALGDTPPRSLKSRAQALKEAHRAEIPRLIAAVIVSRYNDQPGRTIEPALERLRPNAKLFSTAGRRSAALARIRRWAARNNQPIQADGAIPAATLQAYNQAQAVTEW